MSLLRKFSPASITTQMTAIVAISVVLGMTLSVIVVVFFFAGTQDSMPSVTFQAAQITQLLQAATDQADATTILKTARAAGINVRKVAVADLRATDGSVEKSFSNWRISRRLNAIQGIDVLEGFQYPDGPKDQIVVRVDAANALVFNAHVKLEVWRYILTPVAMLLMTVLIFVLLISAYAVRWITAPLAILADAAVSFGLSPRDEHSLKQSGPLEIRQVTDALNEMRTRIRALLDDRTRMLAAISHDLRTPLTRLRLRSERIADETLREAMLRDLTKIGHMLDETLQFLQEDARSEPISRIDLPSMLQTICSDFSDVGNAVDYDGPSRFAYKCRPKELARAITNIVENGTKHGTAVAVKLDLSDTEFVNIRVHDNGPGIPVELREKVFEPFFKADSARGQNGGFGLGLSIARDIVKRHRGEIRMCSQNGRGLEVMVQLSTRHGLDGPA